MTAKQIKLALTNAFPGVKFNVRTHKDYFDVAWAAGPTKQEVKQVAAPLTDWWIFYQQWPSS